MAEIDETISGFIARWQGVTGHERANYQLLLTELTSLLGMPGPEPKDVKAPEGRRNDEAMESKPDRRRAEVEFPRSVIEWTPDAVLGNRERGSRSA